MAEVSSVLGTSFGPPGASPPCAGGRTVYLLGAGFSRAISEDQRLPVEDQMPLTCDFAALLEDSAAFDLNESKALSSLLTSLGADFERLATVLAEPGPWVSVADRLQYASWLERLLDVVGKKLDAQQAVVSRSRCPEWLDQLVRHWHQSRATVITFNYDLLVEAAAKSAGLIECATDLYRVPIAWIVTRLNGVVLGASQAGSFELLKMHGSLAWYREDSADLRFGPVYDNSGLLGFGEGVGTADDDGLDLLAGLRRLIVPPVSSKAPHFSHSLMRAQWERAANALASADELAVIGYSLPQSDLTVRDLIATKFTGSECTVVNTSDDARAAFCTLFASRNEGREESDRLEVVSVHHGENAARDYVSQLTNSPSHSESSKSKEDQQ